MSMNFSAIGRQQLAELIQPIRELLSTAPYNPPESHHVSVKSLLESLLPSEILNYSSVHSQIRDFSLCCALLSSSNSSTLLFINWIPENLSVAAYSAFQALSKAIYGDSDVHMSSEKKLVIELMPEVLSLIKNTIKESSVGGSNADDEISAASARAPLAHAVVAAYQLRWFVSQVEYPQLGEVCPLIIPCGLTALDHWSPEVKGQGMLSFIHIAKNVNAAELGGYGDVILDACCHNIVSGDEIWHHAVEMSVLLATCLQKNNPRSPWFERLLNEMVGHLERQPRNKERRIAWLKLVEPLFYSLGLVLLAHFRRLFPLFFQWLHADDDETVQLVLERICTVVKLTWIRSSPYTVRLVDELAILYKEAALKTAWEEIRIHICQILILLQQCKGLQFEATWKKYKDDPNLGTLVQSIAGNATQVRKSALLSYTNGGGDVSNKPVSGKQTEITDAMLSEMWDEVDGADVSTINAESLRIYEYQGFSPSAILKSLLLGQKRNKIEKTDFINDISTLCAVSVIMGSVNDNNFKKISTKGQTEITRLEGLYGIKRGSGRGEKPEVVTVSRIAAAFPGKVQRLIIGGKVSARKFIGPLKSSTLPGFVRHQSFAAVIPSSLDETAKDFLLNIVTAFSVDQSININPDKKKKPDVVELFDTQRAFIQITADSVYPAEKTRIGIFKTLVIDYDSLLNCARALKAAYPSFTIMEKDAFKRSRGLI